MSRQRPKRDRRKKAEVRAICVHPEFKYKGPYVTTSGNGRKATVWLCNGDGHVGSSVNLNYMMELKFKNKEEARLWAQWYAKEYEMTYVETRPCGEVKF